jgi:hypothetical protein
MWMRIKAATTNAHKWENAGGVGCSLVAGSLWPFLALRCFYWLFVACHCNMLSL